MQSVAEDVSQGIVESVEREWNGGVFGAVIKGMIQIGHRVKGGLIEKTGMPEEGGT